MKSSRTEAPTGRMAVPFCETCPDVLVGFGCLLVWGFVSCVLLLLRLRLLLERFAPSFHKAVPDAPQPGGEAEFFDCPLSAAFAHDATVSIEFE